MRKHTQGRWYVNGGDDVWIGERICIYVGDEDDARLIAAAPDLLEALEELLRVEATHDDGDIILELARNTARYALARARGTE